jgi:hypothetical protein
MSQYNNLIARIRIHCQQTARDAVQSGITPQWAMDHYNGWYIERRKSFIALKKGNGRSEPVFAFPPASELHITETERQLGFSLPVLLRLLYTQIANGGFGPGYGIIGIPGGFPFDDTYFGKDIEEDNIDIVRAYQQEVKWANMLVPLEQYEKDIWIDTLLEEIQRSDGKMGTYARLCLLRNDKEKLEQKRYHLPPLPPYSWPERLLPFVYWGCNISTYIDANTGHIFQGMRGPLLYIADSLEVWLERWLAGEDLQFL